MQSRPEYSVSLT